MGLWKDSQNNIFDDMDGQAIGLPSWPEGLVSITEQEADDIRNGITYIYPAVTITLPFLPAGHSLREKVLPGREFIKTTVEQARVDKLDAVLADRLALLQHSDLVAKEFANVADGHKYAQPNLQWVHQLRGITQEQVESELDALTSIDDILAYQPNFAPEAFDVMYATLTLRQFAMAAEQEGILTQIEAEDFCAIRAIPSAIINVINSINDENDKKEARLRLKSMNIIPRDDGLLEQLFCSAFNKTIEQLDEFFLTAFEL